MMLSVVLLLSSVPLFPLAVSGDPHTGVIRVSADLSGAAHRVDRRFLSVTLDANVASEEKFMYLLSSLKLRTLARALTPSFVRFGGNQQDFMVFVPQRPLRLSSEPSCDQRRLATQQEEQLKAQWAEQVLVLREEMNKFKPVNFTEVTIDQLYDFANCSGMELIFGLNGLIRTADNVWNSTNARSVLQYCESKRYQMSWELGNEPNSYRKKGGAPLDGEQLGQDFTELRRILTQSKFYHNAKLYGPDISQPRDGRTFILDGFLQTGSGAVDACTWHHYYVDGKNTSLEDFLDPDVLDSLGLKINEVLEIVRRESPRKLVWLGETSSAYGGGAVGLSDTFAAGFMWLDKLGLSAKLGLDVVMRQVFFGSGLYHLVDDNLDPLPDYWLSVLHKRLVGPEVLRIKVLTNSSYRRRVRLYLHCANRNRYTAGAVALIAMNIRKRPSRISVPALMSSSTVDAFVLQSERPGEEGLLSRSVRLNGDVLKMVDDQTLPDLTGTRLPAAQHLDLPGFSLGFYIFTDIRPSACLPDTGK